MKNLLKVVAEVVALAALVELNMKRRGALLCLCGIGLAGLARGVLAKTTLSSIPIKRHETAMRAAIAMAAQNQAYPFAAVFIAQVYSIEMPLSQQLLMLLVLMVTSKGIAGVPRASLVVIAAILTDFNLPAAGVLLIMGVDQFLDMARAATNVLGNGLATAVISKWEGELEGHDSK